MTMETNQETVVKAEDTKGAAENAFIDVAEKTGLMPQELEMAKKHGIKIEGVEDKPADDEVKDDKAIEAERDSIRRKPIHEITEEESRKLTKNEQGYYWATKKERVKRQAAESERDYYVMQLQGLKGEVEGLKKTLQGSKAEEAEIDAILAGDDPKPDASKSDKKAYTAEEWRQIEAKERRERETQGNLINARLQSFEIEAKQKYTDFDNTIELAQDIFERAKVGKLSELGISNDSAQEIIGQVKDWITKAANVLDVNTPNLSEIAYLIGQKHPKYADGGKALNDKTIEKIAETKPKTSASIPVTGGVTPVSEITYQQAKDMSLTEWRKLPKETREKLLRG